MLFFFSFYIFLWIFRFCLNAQQLLGSGFIISNVYQSIMSILKRFIILGLCYLSFCLSHLMIKHKDYAHVNGTQIHINKPKHKHEKLIIKINIVSAAAAFSYL